MGKRGDAADGGEGGVVALVRGVVEVKGRRAG